MLSVSHNVEGEVLTSIIQRAVCQHSAEPESQQSAEPEGPEQRHRASKNEPRRRPSAYIFAVTLPPARGAVTWQTAIGYISQTSLRAVEQRTGSTAIGYGNLTSLAEGGA